MPCCSGKPLCNPLKGESSSSIIFTPRISKKKKNKKPKVLFSIIKLSVLGIWIRSSLVWGWIPVVMSLFVVVLMLHTGWHQSSKFWKQQRKTPDTLPSLVQIKHSGRSKRITRAFTVKKEMWEYVLADEEDGWPKPSNVINVTCFTSSVLFMKQ